MRIAIDIRSLQRWDNRFRGIGFYLYNLVENLLTIDRENHFVLFTQDGSMDEQVQRWLERLRDISGGRATTHQVPAGLNPVSVRHQWCLNAHVRQSGADVFHAPVQGALPWLRTYKGVITVHDLVQLRFPQMYLKGIGVRARFQWESRMHAVKTAQRVIAISESTRKDIIEFLGVPEEKIDLIYNGVGEEFRPLTENIILSGLRQKFGIKDKFLFYVGGVEWRKNVSRILEAFNKVHPTFPELSLVIAGKIDDEGQSILAESKAAGHLDGVVFTGFVNNDELVSLYNGCEFVVFPSLYEGFGFPAAEAMACGKTLVTSHVSSLTEVVGDGAICVDPLSVDEIAVGMKVLLTDEHRRKGLEVKARAQVQKFNWRNNARQVLQTYHKAVAP